MPQLYSYRLKNFGAEFLKQYYNLYYAWVVNQSRKQQMEKLGFVGEKKRKRENEPIDIVKEADCLEFMNTLPDDYVDITITSPPYNKKNINMPRVSIKYHSYNDNIKDYGKNQIQVR